MKRHAPPLMLLGATVLALFLSGIGPTDRLTWMLEVAPVVVGLPVLIATYRLFRLSLLVYGLLFFHAVVLVLGGHYTYAEVPVGFWAQDAFELSRNHYDRLGHFAQGFVPAMLAREILIRKSPLAGSRWLGFLVVCFCLAFSAFYEMLEWWSAAALGQLADRFLGTQGDPWDTQWDMFMALIGACLAVILLGRAHDRSLARVIDR